jgi:predicted DNA-binding transcriptional regulator AlpA
MNDEKVVPMVIMKTPMAAKYVGLAESTLCKMRVFGTGPRFCRLGRAIVYRKADLDAWLDARCVASTSEPANDNQSSKAA